MWSGWKYYFLRCTRVLDVADIVGNGSLAKLSLGLQQLTRCSRPPGHTQIGLGSRRANVQGSSGRSLLLTTIGCHSIQGRGRSRERLRDLQIFKVATATSLDLPGDSIRIHPTSPREIGMQLDGQKGQ